MPPNDLAWSLGGLISEHLCMRREHFQVQKRHVQLFQLFLKLLVGRFDKAVGRSQHGLGAFCEMIQVCDHVL